MPPMALFHTAHRSRDLLGYVEVHIEQGPVLEAEKLAVGVVSAIAGQTRGPTGHREAYDAVLARARELTGP